MIAFLSVFIGLVSLAIMLRKAYSKTSSACSFSENNNFKQLSSDLRYNLLKKSNSETSWDRKINK